MKVEFETATSGVTHCPGKISKFDQILYCPTDALNYINCRVIKNTLKI